MPKRPSCSTHPHYQRILDCTATDVRIYAKICHQDGWSRCFSRMDCQCESFCCIPAGKPCYHHYEKAYSAFIHYGRNVYYTFFSSDNVVRQYDGRRTYICFRMVYHTPCHSHFDHRYRIPALAECFISPRFLEYFSLQSPKGEEGLYLGFSHLHSFVSSLVSFIVAGFLLEKFCPDPTSERFANSTNFAADYAAATANAHYLWYVFFAIGFVSAVALIIYGRIVKRLDAKKVTG